MRRALLLLLLLGCSKPAPPQTPTARAIAYLMSRQEDGLWKSRMTTVLGSGQALTPFVLYALSHAPESEVAPHRAPIDRALDRLPIAGSEYPSYSLALSILALKRLRPKTDVAALEKQLRSLQLVEERGFTPEDPEYGGWDHGLLLGKRESQRPDLSVTAFAVEALGGDEKARRFAERCRAADGGFYFTPSGIWSHQNKGGPGKSYATATCDALRILGDDPRGLKWLEGGQSGLDREWNEALFYYYRYARAKVRPSREWAADLIACQGADGSWRNPNALMKEDDPLIATGLALIALSPP